jgi:hypothetical protein
MLNKKSKAHAEPTVTTEHVMSRNFGVSCLQAPQKPVEVNHHTPKIVDLLDAGLLR